MTVPLPNGIQMFERIIRAKVKLEAQLKQHSDTCCVISDPEGRQPCNCGAEEHNRKIREILKEIQF
jgi:hypothetical protein